MINWDTAYTVGNNQIDFEHQIFLNLVNSFQAARLAGAREALINSKIGARPWRKPLICMTSNFSEMN